MAYLAVLNAGVSFGEALDAAVEAVQSAERWTREECLVLDEKIDRAAGRDLWVQRSDPP